MLSAVAEAGSMPVRPSCHNPECPRPTPDPCPASFHSSSSIMSARSWTVLPETTMLSTMSASMTAPAPAPIPRVRGTLSRLAGGALLLGLGATLSGCGPDLPKFAPACPNTGIVLDAADVTRFKSTGTDLTDMVLDGRITGVSGKCSLDDLAHLRTTISVAMDLTRGPGTKSRRADVPYFVSVSRGDTILSKQVYVIPAEFDANADRLRLMGNQIDVILPVSDTLKGSDYRLQVGFQLTPEELAFNRRRGPR